MSSTVAVRDSSQSFMKRLFIVFLSTVAAGGAAWLATAALPISSDLRFGVVVFAAMLPGTIKDARRAPADKRGIALGGGLCLSLVLTLMLVLFVKLGSTR